MTKTLAGWVVAACVGAVLGFFLGSRSTSASKEAAARVATSVNGASSAAHMAPAEVVNPRPADSPAMAQPAPHSPASDAGATDPAAMQNAVVGLAGGKLDAQNRAVAPPLDKLLASMSAYCTLDAGAGGQWPQGRILAHTAAWQGGPLEFDAINLVDQTAQLTRHPWAVASADSAISLSVTATNSGLHFSGFEPNGELLVMTVFGTLDSEARYRAVLSLHGTKLDHESAQFYGWCTIR
jgi:hypothetical protein